MELFGQYFVKFLFEETNVEMAPEHLFDYLWSYFAFSFFLLQVHLEVVKACGDYLIGFIIVDEVFSVLKDWFQNLSITVSI